MDFVLKPMDFVLKPMDFVLKNAGLLLSGGPDLLELQGVQPSELRSAFANTSVGWVPSQIPLCTTSVDCQGRR